MGDFNPPPTSSAASPSQCARCQFSLRQLFAWVSGIGFGLAVLLALTHGVRHARQAAISSSSQGPLNQLHLALHNYYEEHGHFPPAYIADEDGTPMHSWRVLVLPYIDERALYNAYDFTEPWNGPNNLKLANQMPRLFRSPSEKESRTFTNIVAVTGPGTAFPDGETTTMPDFVDGLENTILLTEIANSQVLWLAPRDIDVRTMHLPEALRMSAARWRRPYVVFADRLTAYEVREDIPPEALRALTTIGGREPITRSQLIRQGYLE